MWVEVVLPQICEDLFNPDIEVQKQNRAAFYCYVDQVMYATYSRPLNFEHECNESAKRSNALDVLMNELAHNNDCNSNHDYIITLVNHQNNDCLCDYPLSDVPQLLTRFQEDDHIDDILEELESVYLKYPMRNKLAMMLKLTMSELW
jgi:hypothetical protein